MESDKQIFYRSEQKKERAYSRSFFFLFAVLIIVDQTTKHFALHIFKNNQFAFSLPVPALLMYIIYFCVLAAMVYYVSKNYEKFNFLVKLGWTLIFAGAVSNIGERIIAGSVKDFIYIIFLKQTGVYNVADFFIIAGVILLLVSPPLRLTKE